MPTLHIALRIDVFHRQLAPGLGWRGCGHRLCRLDPVALSGLDCLAACQRTLPGCMRLAISTFLVCWFPTCRHCYSMPGRVLVRVLTFVLGTFLLRSIGKIR